MRKSCFFAAALMAAVWVGCSQDEHLDFVNENKSNFTGIMEIMDSRTSLNEANEVVWNLNDEVSIFEGDNANSLYRVSSITDGKADFDFVSYTSPTEWISLDANYAVYPYNEKNSIDANGEISVLVPAEYTFTDKESSVAEALMVAKSEDSHLNFTNAQGILCLRLNAQKAAKYGAIESIKFTSNDDDIYLSGTATMSWDETNNPPIAKITDGSKELTVTLDESLQDDLLPESTTGEYAEYYVPIVPMEFGQDDLTMTITWTSGDTYEKTVNSAFSVGRAKIMTIKHTIGKSGFDGVIEEDGYVEPFTVEDLYKWAYAVNHGEVQYSLELKNDITMPAFEIEEDDANKTYRITDRAITVTDGVPSGSNWIPLRTGITTLSEGYSGSIDGKGCTISGLYIKQNSKYAGLIGYAYNGASVKNLTIENSAISGTGYVGAIMGESQHNTLVENVQVKNSTISGTGSVGGIVGENYSRNVKANGIVVGEKLAIIKNCSIDKDSSIKGTGEIVGGICGTNNGAAVIYCKNSADVTGKSLVGGVVGMNRAYNTGRDGYVIACGSTEESTITATDGYAGGIVG